MAHDALGDVNALSQLVFCGKSSWLKQGLWNYFYTFYDIQKQLKSLDYQNNNNNIDTKPKMIFSESHNCFLIVNA